MGKPEKPDQIRDLLNRERQAFIAHGDCRKRLQELPDNSIDAVVTDPPAGIEFLGKSWDSFKDRDANASGKQSAEWHSNDGKNPYARGATPRYQGKTNESLLPFQDFIAEVFTEVYRVLKPGGHALVWAIPRTSHHTMMGLERAGFDIRDVIQHLFGVGFPKSLAVDKSIDKSKGAERKVTGVDASRAARLVNQTGRYQTEAGWSAGNRSADITAPATDEAKRWSGWGTALKPAAEVWVLCRKPLVGTVAANVLEHGTGALNIDGCRIGTNVPPLTGGGGKLWSHERDGTQDKAEPVVNRTGGRWPANLTLSHAPGCKKVGTKTVKTSVLNQTIVRSKAGSSSIGKQTDSFCTGYADSNGNETVEAWECEDGCPIKLLDEQSAPKMHSAGGARDARRQAGPSGMFLLAGDGNRFGDSGGASRFFYTSKAPSKEKYGVVTCACTNKLKVKDVPVVTLKEAREQQGQPCEVCGEKKELQVHPTVKSIALMRWLITLITPPGGVVLDPFTGSGTTGVAAVKLGFRFLGVEQDKTYVALSRHRVKHATEHHEAAPKPPKTSKATKARPSKAKSSVPLGAFARPTTS